MTELMESQIQRTEDACMLSFFDRRPWWRRMLSPYRPTAEAIETMRKVAALNYREAAAEANAGESAHSLALIAKRQQQRLREARAMLGHAASVIERLEKPERDVTACAELCDRIDEFLKFPAQEKAPPEIPAIGADAPACAEPRAAITP